MAAQRRLATAVPVIQSLETIIESDSQFSGPTLKAQHGFNSPWERHIFVRQIPPNSSSQVIESLLTWEEELGGICWQRPLSE